MPLAHELLVQRAVPVAPGLLAAIAFALVIAAARFARPANAESSPSVDHGGLARALLVRPTGAGWVLRAAGTLLFVGGLLAGALGRDSQLDNLAPALLVGFGWPALLAAEALVGGVFARLNPFDTLARALSRFGAPDGDPADDVRVAAIAAGLWGWYLAVPQSALGPRTVAAVLGGYTLVTLAGCLATGRVRWLSGAEFFTVTFGWLTLARRGELATWASPRGARALVAGLVGGLLAGQLRDTHLYDPLRTRTHEWLWHTLALVAIVLLIWVVLWSAERALAAGPATRAAIWLVVGVGLALALARSRVLTSAQLLPHLLSDPLGRGWDLFGAADVRSLVARPLTEFVRVVTQLVLVTASALAAAWSIARRFPDDVAARGTPAATIGVITWAAIAAFSSI